MLVFDLTKKLVHRNGSTMVEPNQPEGSPVIEWTMGYILGFVADQPSQTDFMVLSRIGDMIYGATRGDHAKMLELNQSEASTLKRHAESVLTLRQFPNNAVAQVLEFLDNPE